MRDAHDSDPVDDLVRALYDDRPAMSEQVFTEGRSRLKALMEQPEPPVLITPQPPRTSRSARRWMPAAMAAAAIVVVSAGVVVVVNTPEQIGVAGGGTSGYPPTPSREPSASDGSMPTELPPVSEEPLNPAGEVVPTVIDPEQQDGQYRYVSRHMWYRTGDRAGLLNKPGPGQAVSEEWVPADRTQDWQLILDRDIDRPGEPYGDEFQRPDSQVAGDSQDEGTFVAPRGRYLVTAETAGSLKHPTPEFLAALPRDPRELYELLCDEVRGGQDAQGMLFTRVLSLMEWGTVPADLRAALYGALGYHPWVVVNEHAQTRDGRRAVSIWAEDRIDETKMEMLIDPANGELIGTRISRLDQPDRSVSAEKQADLLDGTVLLETTVDYNLVEELGARP